MLDLVTLQLDAAIDAAVTSLREHRPAPACRPALRGIPRPQRLTTALRHAHAGGPGRVTLPGVDHLLHDADQDVLRLPVL
ncbi:hypothetical protein [Streptomyces aurantiacus]|uniref:hypothetical protein n=1 Tax=Streptomyces aurantiacus TaxID=47760 RepID=UPI000AE1232C|nr:hypothetical protein [Streptomyces aurantiacus]